MNDDLYDLCCCLIGQHVWNGAKGRKSQCEHCGSVQMKGGKAAGPVRTLANYPFYLIK